MLYDGRIGRLLIVLQRVAEGAPREPLYPSLFFKTHRALYYELLNEVRLHGDWERWLDFFAEGIAVGECDAGGRDRTRSARPGERGPRPDRGSGSRRTFGAGGTEYSAIGSMRSS